MNESTDVLKGTVIGKGSGEWGCLKKMQSYISWNMCKKRKENMSRDKQIWAKCDRKFCWLCIELKLSELRLSGAKIYWSICQHISTPASDHLPSCRMFGCCTWKGWPTCTTVLFHTAARNKIVERRNCKLNGLVQLTSIAYNMPLLVHVVLLTTYSKHCPNHPCDG